MVVKDGWHHTWVSSGGYLKAQPLICIASKCTQYRCRLKKKSYQFFCCIEPTRRDDAKFYQMRYMDTNFTVECGLDKCVFFFKYVNPTL